MDIGEKFLTTDGTLTQRSCPTGCTRTCGCYKIWAEAIAGRVKELMK
jgi:N-acetylglucosamine-6-sulfatase